MNAWSLLYNLLPCAIDSPREQTHNSKTQNKTVKMMLTYRTDSDARVPTALDKSAEAAVLSTVCARQFEFKLWRFAITRTKLAATSNDKTL
jgi:hypothetical protein